MENQNMQPEKKKKPRWPLAAAVIVLVLIGGAVLAYFTVHQWTEPTCTTPGVCTICGKIGIPAAGHQWTPATCTTPKTCGVCSETEGAPLDHDLQDNYAYDYVKCIKETWAACSRCEYRKGSRQSQLTSLLDERGEYFLLSPNQFKERLEVLIPQYDPEMTVMRQKGYDDLKNITFRWAAQDDYVSEFGDSMKGPILECWSGSEKILCIVLYDFIENRADIRNKDLEASFSSVFLFFATPDHEKYWPTYWGMEHVLIAACDPAVEVNSFTTSLLASIATKHKQTKNNDLVYGFIEDACNIFTLNGIEKAYLNNN